MIKSMNRLNFIIVIVLFLCLSLGLSALEFAGGSGSSEDPWLIQTAKHLDNLRQYLGEEHTEKHFRQIAEIDLFDITREGAIFWNEGKGWKPIGEKKEKVSLSEIHDQFMGTYDGGVYSISGMFINRPEEEALGLFGFIVDASIKNVGLKDVSIIGQRYVGGIAGLSHNSKISSSYVTGNVTGKSRGVGGLVGQSSTTTIENCYTIADVTGAYHVGQRIYKFKYN